MRLLPLAVASRLPFMVVPSLRAGKRCPPRVGGSVPCKFKELQSKAVWMLAMAVLIPALTT